MQHLSFKMADLGWLSTEAKKVHDFFLMSFYSLVGVFFLLAIVLEYFKLPLGNAPSFPTLLGRTFIAIFLLHTYHDISNLIGDIADQASKDLGGYTNIHLVLAKMGEKCNELTTSWISVKDAAMLLISFVCFFLLYFSVHVTEAFTLYAWTILYVFSPILIALFIFPQTAKATSALYRSLIEVSLWKLMWAVLATLLWSAALSKINDPQYHISLLSALCLNLILASSLIMTPKIIHMLAGQGISGIASTVGLAALGAAAVGPLAVAKKGMGLVRTGGKMMGAGASGSKNFVNNIRKNKLRRDLEKNLYNSPSMIEDTLKRRFPARRRK
jgi:hypothetical protein